MRICPRCNKTWDDGVYCAVCGEKLKEDEGDALFSANLDTLVAMAEEQAAHTQSHEDLFSRFEVQSLSDGKYIITELKNKTDMIVRVPEGVQAIGEGAFEGSDVMEVSLPKGLLKIDARAFADCVDLDTINFPDTLRIIGEEAFCGCLSLNVTPPDSVRIAEDAFRNTAIPGEDEESRDEKDMASLERIMNRVYEVEFDPYFIGAKMYNYTAIIYSVKDKSIEEAEVPFFVTRVGDFAFSECKDLRRVSFDYNGVKSFGNAVFNGCESLEEILLPDGVAAVSDSMFYGCKNLTEVILPDTVKMIERVGFCQCRSLEKIDLPAGLKLLDDWAFLECGSLKQVTIPEWIARIGYGAFCQCRSLASVTLNPRLEIIADRAFDGCESLTEITIPDSVRVIGENAFYKCYSLKTAKVPPHLRGQFEAALEPTVRQTIQYIE